MHLYGLKERARSPSSVHAKIFIAFSFFILPFSCLISMLKKVISCCLCSHIQLDRSELEDGFATFELIRILTAFFFVFLLWYLIVFQICKFFSQDWKKKKIEGKNPVSLVDILASIRYVSSSLSHPLDPTMGRSQRLPFMFASSSAKSECCALHG